MDEMNHIQTNHNLSFNKLSIFVFITFYLFHTEHGRYCLGTKRVYGCLMNISPLYGRTEHFLCQYCICLLLAILHSRKKNFSPGKRYFELFLTVGEDKLFTVQWLDENKARSFYIFHGLWGLLSFSLLKFSFRKSLLFLFKHPKN